MLTKNKLSRILALSIPLSGLAACGGGGSGGESNFLADDPVPNFSFAVDSDFASQTSEDFIAFVEEDLGNSVETLNRIQNFFNNTTIPVSYTACEEANAFYSLLDRSITLCHELTNLGYNYYLQQDEETLDEESRQAIAFNRAFAMMNFVLYHEMGHAMDDLRELGIGGNFESVADAISVVLSVQTGQPQAGIYGGLFFLIDTNASFGDEHIGGADRAGDILCWTIGSSSLVAAAFPSATDLFNNEGRDCVGEYANQHEFVTQLIPFLDEVPPKSALKTSEAALAAEFAGMDDYMVEMLGSRDR
ncbi:DUF4344 domain-containing metallopeptidase [Granulosicoccus sp. 3-233]|uniref:DUF4344 domain-containing metallopeptidase n=1 Tax=Granulosicoccus sp. 3-233 TaxID=3417969 RepID=UPI003D32694A